MPPLDCSHDSAPYGGEICPHLREASDNDYIRVYTGLGFTYQLACEPCGDALIATIPWLSVCDSCFARIEADNGWQGIRGIPEVREAPADLDFLHRQVERNDPDPFRQVLPLTQARISLWMGLTESGALFEMDLDAGTFTPIATIFPTDVDISKPLSLTCSADGAFLCVTETHDQRSVVIDRQTGRRTLRLQRDGYWNHFSPFSAAFVQNKGKTLLLHATAWNRLDISDAATGELWTERSPTSYEDDESRPPHYLDYFHCHLLVSPNQEFVADNGWVWHPAGVIRTWSVKRWREENPWESEDGPSAKQFTHRYYYWDGPLCWIDSRTLAVWGYGNDKDCLAPAVQLFDVVSGEEKPWFAATGNKESADYFAPRLFFDRYLFAAVEKFGISVWDTEKGARIYQDASFAPIAYHPVTQEFLTLLPDGALQLSRLIGHDTGRAGP
jgi:hypothetical protein